VTAAPGEPDRRSFFNFRNSLVLMGILITTIGLIYFATAFSDVITQWGRVLDFFLLTVIYVALGLHFASTETSHDLVHARGWRWLRTTTAFYVLGLVGAGATIVAFLSVQGVDRAVKLLVIVALGLGLILVAATRLTQRGERP
jgi:uncharacterized membrane protein YkvI